MKINALFRTIAIVLFLVSVQLAAHAQGCSTSPDLTTCVNTRIVELVKAGTDKNSNTKQTEPPSSSGNSSSLVDQSSASDLVGVGLNLAGLTANSNSTDNEPHSVSVTTSAYALYAAFKGVDPLNPDFYNAHRDWRRFSVTLGYDEEKLPSGDTQKAKLFGVKYLVINHRDPNRREFEDDLIAIREQLKASTTVFSDVINKVKTFIFTNDLVVTSVIKPDFAAFLVRKETEVDLAKLTAAKIALVARQTAATSNNPQAVKNAADEAQRAELRDSFTVDKNAAATEVTDAIDQAVAAGKNAQDVAAAAQVAADKYAITAEPKKLHITQLKSQVQDIKTLFVFENGFVANNSDQVLLEFRKEFVDNYMTGPGFAKIKAELGDSLSDEIDKQLNDVASFKQLRKVSLAAIDKIRRAPQLSVAYFTKQRKEGIDEHKSEVIFEWGVAPKWNLTANAAFEYNDSSIIGGDTRGGSFAAQFRYQVNHNDLASLLRNQTPIFFDLSAEGSRKNGEPTILKAQAKLTIPLWNSGIQFPISVTVANRTELIKEKEVRGQFGFTFDFSKLIAAMQTK
jgi:hypothetical protein